MRTEDVTDTLELALKASGCDQAKAVHKPRLLSDNGSSYISGDLAEWLENQSMEHVRGAPSHPQTQGKIERWHQTLKNRILLENYYLPGDLEAQLGAFVEHYNHRRYHESLNKPHARRCLLLGAAKPSCWKGKGSNERPSNTGACNIATPLPKIINQVSQSLRYFRPHPVSNHLTTDMLTIEVCPPAVSRCPKRQFRRLIIS